MISSFSPTAAAAGETVQIEGLLFKPTPGENVVRFNGTAGTVLSASGSTLVAVVPAGATTGPIEVITAGGSSSTSKNFTVLSSNTSGMAWTTRMTGPSDRLTGIAWNGTNFVTVGSSIQTSPDALRWTEREPMGSFNDVAWDGQTFIAVDSFGDIQSSSDGLTWTTRSGLNGGETLYSVAKSSTRWVAVGRQGTIVASSDGGLNWTPSPSPTTNHLNSVAWSGTKFVAGGESGTIITSPDGLSWSVQASGTTASITAVGATPSTMLAATAGVSTSPSAILISSDDGALWSQAIDTNDSSFTRIINAGGKWVVVGYYTVMTSPDGWNWSTAVNGPGNAIGVLNSVVYADGQYVAAGQTGYSVAAIYTSPDASKWTLRTSEQNYNEMTRSPDGRIVAVAGSAESVTSLDGITWEYGSLSGNSFQDVSWFGGLNAFVGLVRESANRGLYQSTDGKTWARLGNAPYSGTVEASPTLLVNLGSDYVTSAGIATSPDGVNWTRRTNPSGQPLRYVMWTGSQFVAVGDAGSIATSTDGASWIQRANGVTETLRGAVSSPTLFVAVGDNGTIVTSSDGGATWIARNSGTTSQLRRVAWTGATFIAVGGNGLALSSTDGVNWTIQATPYITMNYIADLTNLNDLVWTGSTLVVVGNRGLLATSP